MTTDRFIACTIELGPGHRGWMEWHQGSSFGRLEDPTRAHDRYDKAGVDPFRLTIRLLRAGSYADLATIVDTIGPNHAMMPVPGLYGFLARPHLLVVLHAVELAHVALHTIGWDYIPLELSLDERANLATDVGGWLDLPDGGRWDDGYERAVAYYRNISALTHTG